MAGNDLHLVPELVQVGLELGLNVGRLGICQLRRVDLGWDPADRVKIIGEMEPVWRDVYIGIPELVRQPCLLSGMVFYLVDVHEDGLYPGRLSKGI